MELVRRLGGAELRAGDLALVRAAEHVVRELRDHPRARDTEIHPGLAVEVIRGALCS